MYRNDYVVESRQLRAKGRQLAQLFQLYKALGLANIGLGALGLLASPVSAIPVSVGVVAYLMALATENKRIGRLNPIPWVKEDLETIAQKSLTEGGAPGLRLETQAHHYLDDEDKALYYLCNFQGHRLTELAESLDDESFEHIVVNLVDHLVAAHSRQLNYPEILSRQLGEGKFFKEAVSNLPPELGHAVPVTPAPDRRRFEELKLPVNSPLKGSSESPRPSLGPITRLSALPVSASPVDAAEEMNPAAGISEGAAPPPGLYDVTADMGRDLQNTLIVGKGGAGKGILLSNGVRHALETHPRLKIVGIDPKGAETEQGYWRGCYQVFRKQTFGLAPESIAAWLNASIDQFMALPGPKLLIVDECKHLSQTLKRCNDKGQAFNLFWYRIESFTSLGDEQQTYVWAISQTAHTQDLAVSGGTRSMFRAIAIVHYKDPGYVHSLVGTTLIPEPKEGVGYVTELIKESPVGRAFYCSKRHHWFAMPTLQNYSTVDRDTRTEIAPAASSADSPIVGQVMQQGREANTSLNKADGARGKEIISDAFEDLFREDYSANSELKTDWIDANIETLKQRKNNRSECMAELLAFIRKEALEGKTELKRGELTTGSWASKWKKRGTEFRDCSGHEFNRFLNTAVKAEFLSTEDHKTYLIKIS